MENPYIQPNYQPNEEEITNNQNQINRNHYVIGNLPLVEIQNIYNSSPERLNSDPIEQIPNNLPNYISATPKLLADIDHYDVGNSD